MLTRLVLLLMFVAVPACIQAETPVSRDERPVAAFVDWQTVDVVSNWPPKTTITFGRMGYHRWCEIQTEGKPTVRRFAATMQEALHLAISDVLALINEATI